MLSLAWLLVLVYRVTTCAQVCLARGFGVGFPRPWGLPPPPPPPRRPTCSMSGSSQNESRHGPDACRTEEINGTDADLTRTGRGQGCPHFTNTGGGGLGSPSKCHPQK
eukprot:gene8865-biopygen9211